MAESHREGLVVDVRYNGGGHVSQLLIERLPEIAAAVASPLAKVDKIVLVGGGEAGSAGVEKITGSVARVIAQLPAVVEGVSGIDLSALLARLANPEPAKKELPEAAIEALPAE